MRKKSINFKEKITAKLLAIILASIALIVSGIGAAISAFTKDIALNWLQNSPFVQEMIGNPTAPKKFADSLHKANVDEKQLEALDRAYEICQDKINRSNVDLGDPIAIYEETVKCFVIDESQGKLLHTLSEHKPELAHALNKLNQSQGVQNVTPPH